jgi:nucleoside-diphosphate-sugar epimerase
MKIVITGALGHIGSHVVRMLPESFPKADVVMIDNMMTQRFASLFDLPAIGRYRFIEADVRRADLDQIVDGAHAVIHLAAITDAAGTADKAELVEANNFEATRAIADACVRNHARLIMLSSTSVYGPQSSLVSEDCAIDELRPQSPYAATKLKEERLLQRLAAENGLRCVCFRFGTIFGASPGMRFHTAVNKFCWQAVMGQPLTVWKTAYHQVRPYLDLVDAGRAIAFAIERDMFDGRIYNVVTLNATVSRIIDAIRGFVDPVEITFVDSPIMNQLSYEVAADRIANRGFVFTGDLLRGIGDTVALLRVANAG